MSQIDDFLSGGGQGAGSTIDDFLDTGPKKRRERSALDVIRDAGVVGAKAAVGLPQAFVGLADIATLGRAGKALEDLGYRPGDAQKTLEGWYSEAQQDANREVQQAEGFTGTLQALADNPSVIATSVGESLPQMLGGAGLARGMVGTLTKVAPKVAPIVAGAIGEGLMTAGSQAAQTREESADKLLTLKQAVAALAAGAGTAVMGYAGGRLADRLGLADVDTMLAAGAKGAPIKNAAGLAKQLVGSGISEGVFEELPQSMQEQIWQNYAQDKPLLDGVDKAGAMGLATGAVMGVAGGGYNAALGRSAQGVQDGQQQNEAQAQAGAPAGSGAAAATGTAVAGTEAGAGAAAGGDPTEAGLVEPSAAEQALKSVRELTALDRADRIGQDLGRIDERLAELSRPDAGYGPMFDTERQELAQQRAELGAEREAITATWPKRIDGAPTSFATEAGVRLDGQYALIEADDLVSSHDINLRSNPAYPAELQPRQRDRAASEMQISGIVQKIDPARLGLSADAATGAPIIGADGLVESGNGRTIALQRVYQANGAKADTYRDFLRQNAAQFGIAPESVDALAKPVLVRVRHSPVDRAEFARQANAATVAQMSPAEQARADAKRIDSMDDLQPDDAGDFSGPASRDFVRRFMARLPVTEQAGMVDSQGGLSSAGYTRVRNAVLARAYGDSPVLQRMVESMDDNQRNVSRALMMAAPRVAQMRQAVAEGNRWDADITPDLVGAVEELARLKDGGTSVSDALAQQDMLGEKFSPETREILQFLADNARRPRRMADFIVGYMEALDAAGNPQQGSLLDEPQAPSKGDLMAMAKRGIDGQPTEDAQRSVAGEGAQDGAPAGGQPAAAQDNPGADQGAGPARAAAEQQQGQAVGEQWQTFPADTESLGLPRAEMPQIRAEHRGAMVNFLKARGVEHAQDEVSAAELRPTQAEFSPGKVQAAMDREGGDRSILVSQDGYVLDGHHQWLAHGASGDPVKVIRFDAPIERLLQLAREFPSSTLDDAGAAAARAVMGGPAATLQRYMPKRQARTFDEARAAAKEFQGKPLQNADSGLEASVSRGSLDKMLSAKAVGKSESPATHALAVANLDHLFERAVHGWSKPDRNNDPNIQAVHRFFAPMLLDGRARLVKLTVKETLVATDANKLYTVEAVELNEEVTAAQWLEAAAREDGVEISGHPQRGVGSRDSRLADPKETLAQPHGVTLGRSTDEVISLAEQVEAINRLVGAGGAGSDEHVRRVEQLAQSVARAWANPPEITVIGDMDDPLVPASVRKLDESQKALGATGEPAGFIHAGRVYLVANQLADQADVIRVLFHEALGHFGLRGAFGDSLKPILTQLAAARPDLMNAKAREYGLDLAKPGDRMMVAEEVLAELAQSKPELGFVRRAVAAIRTWLRERVPGMADLELSDDEIIQRYILPARGFVERGRGEADSKGLYEIGEKDQTSAHEDPAPYTHDLFGEPVSAHRGNSRRAGPAAPSVLRDLHTDTPVPPGTYFVETGVSTETKRQIGTGSVTSAADAALAAQGLRKSAVERFDGIVTDKDGKVLATIGGFKGAISQAPVYADTLGMEAVRIPGAKNVWWVHNHPSGKPELSNADRLLERSLDKVFRGSGIEPHGLLAVGNDQFQHTLDGDDTTAQIPNVVKPITVPAYEREILRTDENRVGVSSPADARRLAREFHSERGSSGILLLDAQLKVSAWVPIQEWMLGQLRSGRLSELYRAASHANASAAIIAHDGNVQGAPNNPSHVEPIANIAAALGLVGVRALDSINVKTGESVAEQGLDVAASSVFSRAKGTGSPDERADEIISKPVGSAKPLDRVARAVTKATGIEKLTSAVYDRAGALLDQFVPERVKAGVISDYGVPEAVIDQRALLQGRQRVQLRQAGTLVDKLSMLTRAESRVAYAWMNEQDPAVADELMKQLPEDSVKVLRDVQQMIDRLSREAVSMGQLSAEAYERNKFAYLRRSYAKHVAELQADAGAEQGGSSRRTGRALSILGDQYKGRGIVQEAAMRQVQNVAPKWWGRKLREGKADTSLKGQQFVRLERYAPSGEGTGTLEGMEAKPRGKLQEVVYHPAGEPMPARFTDWEQAGTFEVRDVKGDKLVLWRDFTKAEREAMGEIDEARFAIAKTLQGMVHDVEVGRYLEWLAHKYAAKAEAAVPGTVVEASERYRDTFKPGEWVQVPDTKIAGTDVAKYGKLAGRYLPGPIWNDLRQVVNGQFRPFGDTFAKVMSMWKTAKTALSPAVHTNNVMSNLVMADWHDVSAGHVAKALRIVLGAHERDGQGALGRVGNAASRAGIADSEAARQIMSRYADSGGDIGSWATNEIAQQQLEPLLEALEAELAQQGGDGVQTQIGVMAALQHLVQLKLPQAWDAFTGSVPAKAVAGEAKSLIALYQAEDDVFRLAAWLKAKEAGATDLDAGKAARRSFLDYSVNAPWIQAMRSSGWPFIAFTYRAVPMLLEIAGKKPHKLLKLMALAGGLNALGVALGGGGDDDERKLLPEEKAGKIWGMVPKLVRMPWNDANGSPVYLDIRRFIPVGDVLDVGQGQSAIPLLPGLQPGGPLVIIGELVLNRSAFTGKNITLETDTGGEQAAKVFDHLFKAFAPNLLGLPGTYATQGVADAMKGRTDAFGREMSVAQAAGSAFGVKLGSYPTDVLRRNLVAKAAAETSEIDKNLAQLKRQRQTNRLSAEEFADESRAQMEKKAKIQRELAAKLAS